MSFFSGISLNPFKGYGGDPLIQLLKGAKNEFNNPDIEGLSEAEKAALRDQKVAEESRKRRLLEGNQRRTRVALGSIGGARSLLYGGAGYTGTGKVTTNAPDATIDAPASTRAADPVAAPAPAAKPRTLVEALVERSTLLNRRRQVVA